MLILLTRNASAQLPQTTLRDAQARAVRYLAAEVPRWRIDHPCYSCHNNGDAARALSVASRRGFDVGAAMTDTAGWLSQPERWDSNQSRGGSEDLPLGRIQFASALSAIAASGSVPRAALDHAAQQVVSHQAADGAWHLGDGQTVGGPTFYGTALATAMSRRALASATPDRVATAISRADAWLRRAVPVTVVDAASILLGLAQDRDPAAVSQRRRALELLKKGQGPDGGWGPFVVSQSEPFDTALALLALATVRAPAVDSLSTEPYTVSELETAIRRGREHLVATEGDDGSWPETTRPAGGESYAQRVSTTAWALLALLESN